jgi:hypothetical protein
LAHYRVELLASNGALVEERLIDAEDDAAAIDHAGAIRHPHEINLWRDGRFVAGFRPWPARRGGE